VRWITSIVVVVDRESAEKIYRFCAAHKSLLK